MFGSEEICLWLEAPKYNALRSILTEEGTDIDTEAQRLLDQMYEQKVPLAQREEIDRAIDLDRQLSEERRQASRTFCAIRKIKDGAALCYESERAHFYNLARVVRTLALNKRHDVHLPTYVPDAAPIDQETYRSRMEQHQRVRNVTGVYEINFDTNSLSELRNGEWWSYPLNRVSVAMWKVDRANSTFNLEDRLDRLLKHLEPHMEMYPADEAYETALTDVCSQDQQNAPGSMEPIL